MVSFLAFSAGSRRVQRLAPPRLMTHSKRQNALRFSHLHSRGTDFAIMPTDRRISGSGRLALGLWLAVCTALLGLGAAESLGAASQAPVVYAPALLIDASIEKISGPRPGSGNGWTQCARIVLPDDARADLSSSGWEATLEISGGRIAKHGSAVLEVGSTAADFSLEEKDADGKNARTYSLRSLPSADHRSLPRIEFCVDYRTQWGASVSFFALRADLEDEISPEQRRRMRYVKDGRAYALQKETAIPKILTRRDRHVIQVRQAGSEMFFANWDTGTCRCLSNRNAVNPLNDLVAGRTSARTTTATPVAQPDMPSPPPPPPAVTTSQTRTSSRTTATTTKPKPSPTALIAGRVYLDANANGKYDDGEIGIPNVALFLTGTDTKGTALNVATKTDADGLYAFGDLWGTTTGFTVTEVQPAGFVDSGSPTTRITVPTLSIGTVLLDQNFGERAVAVTGNVLLESNQSPVPNVTIKIYPADSSGNKISGSAPVATAVTDYQGQYLLAPVSANQNYVIERDLPTAYKDPSSGALFLVIGTGSNLVSPDNNFNLALVNPAINPAPSGTIGGIVYVDWNSNGVYDTETPISGVVLRLTGIEDTGTAVSRLQITKPNGQFKWVGLRPGRYNIREYQPTGAYDSLGPTTSISNITVMDGMFSLNNNFGEIVLWTMTRTSSTSATRTQVSKSFIPGLRPKSS